VLKKAGSPLAAVFLVPGEFWLVDYLSGKRLKVTATERPEEQLPRADDAAAAAEELHPPPPPPPAARGKGGEDGRKGANGGSPSMGAEGRGANREGVSSSSRSKNNKSKGKGKDKEKLAASAAAAATGDARWLSLASFSFSSKTPTFLPMAATCPFVELLIEDYT